MMAPFATDGKHLVRIGVPATASRRCCLEPGEGSSTLPRRGRARGRRGARWGLPVLYDVTVTFCG